MPLKIRINEKDASLHVIQKMFTANPFFNSPSSIIFLRH